MQGSERDTDVKRLLDYVGEGEGGMIWENSIETCILLLGECVISSVLSLQQKFEAMDRLVL